MVGIFLWFERTDQMEKDGSIFSHWCQGRPTPTRYFDVTQKHRHCDAISDAQIGAKLIFTS